MNLILLRAGKDGRFYFLAVPWQQHLLHTHARSLSPTLSLSRFFSPCLLSSLTHHKPLLRMNSDPSLSFARCAPQPPPPSVSLSLLTAAVSSGSCQWHLCDTAARGSSHSLPLFSHHRLSDRIMRFGRVYRCLLITLLCAAPEYRDMLRLVTKSLCFPTEQMHLWLDESCRSLCLRAECDFFIHEQSQNKFNTSFLLFLFKESHTFN